MTGRYGIRKYGTVFYELEEMISGKYKKNQKKAIKMEVEEDVPFGPPPEAVQLSMFSV